jgi:hypothetical protein
MIDQVYKNVAEFRGDSGKSVACISKSIDAGCLLIIVGAGVSMATTTQKSKAAGGSFFPSWGVFVEKLGAKANVANDGRDNLGWADEIERVTRNKKEDFAKIVEDVIYEDFPGYDVKEIDREWFFSICSLIAKCRDRRPLFIINLNYDDTLEWFLSKFGYSVSVLSHFPSLIEKCDVVSIHPHGFLPRSIEFSKYRDDNIVLTGKHYRRLNRLDDWFHQILQVLIGQSVSLQIGLSGEDPHILNLFEKVASDMKIARILGFRLIRSTGIDRNESPMEDALVSTIKVGNFNEIPEILYKIASGAK